MKLRNNNEDRSKIIKRMSNLTGYSARMSKFIVN